MNTVYDTIVAVNALSDRFARGEVTFGDVLAAFNRPIPEVTGVVHLVEHPELEQALGRLTDEISDSINCGNGMSSRQMIYKIRKKVTEGIYGPDFFDRITRKK